MREDLERLAREAGMHTDCMNMGAASCVYSEGCHGVAQAELERFAELVAQQTREECAKVCDGMVLYTGFDCAAAIRNMGSGG